jgi:cytochrome c peroxidase
MICCLLLLSLLIHPESAYAAEPAGLPPISYPKDNLPTDEKIALGKQLYFDGRLSSDNKVSCASCHDPAKGFSNGDQFATGVEGKKGGRNSPTVINAALQQFQFWDGRAKSLEGQALGPIQNSIEMNMPLEAVVARLNGIEGYKSQFQKVFGTEVTSAGIGKAIAAYERTILSGDAPYDRFKAGDPLYTLATLEHDGQSYGAVFGQCHQWLDRKSGRSDGAFAKQRPRGQRRGLGPRHRGGVRQGLPERFEQVAKQGRPGGCTGLSNRCRVLNLV